MKHLLVLILFTWASNWKTAESKRNVVRIRVQCYLVMVMGIICVGNRFTKLWSTKFVQENLILISYSFTKVWIPQSYFYLIIRFLSPYQNSYFTKLQVTLNFSDKLHILNTNNIVKLRMLVLNNSKIWYKDTIQVCFTLRSENTNFLYPDSAQKLPTPLR